MRLKRNWLKPVQYRYTRARQKYENAIYKFLTTQLGKNKLGTS